MERILIKDIKPAKEALVYGFVQEVRELSSIIFLVIRDVSGLIQTVVKKDNKSLFDLAKKITKESVVSVTGEVKASKQAPGGKELVVEKLEIISEAETPLPIPVVEKGDVTTTLDKRLDWRFLDLRKQKNLLIIKVLSTLERGMRDYWYNNGFIEIHSPKFMGSPSESGAELFMVPYFGKEAYLAQSPQFYKQMAMCAGFEKVFEIGPVFRANPSHTTRHDTEYTSVDMEVSFINSHHDLMKIEEQWLVNALNLVKKEHGKEIKELFGLDIEIPKTPFPKITIKEGYEISAKRGGKPEIDGDLGSNDEKLIGDWAKEVYKSDFVFVTDYPWSVKPFYHMKNADGKTTKSFDLLYKGLEITSGAQREHHYEQLKKQAEEKKLNMDILKDYLNFFKYGCPPHGGLGLSSTRVVMQMLNLGNVREATYLPRDTERITP